MPIPTDPRNYACKSAMRTPFWPYYDTAGKPDRIEFWLAEMANDSGQQFQLFYNQRIYLPMEHRWLTAPERIELDGSHSCDLATAVNFLHQKRRAMDPFATPLPEHEYPAALQSYAAVPTYDRILPAFGLICDNHGRLARCIDGRPADKGLYSDDKLLLAAQMATAVAVAQISDDATCYLHRSAVSKIWTARSGNVSARRPCSW